MSSYEGGAVMRRRNPFPDDHDEHFGAKGRTGYHEAGKPIGFFAARKTPYAKKLVSKKLLIFLFVLLPILFIINLVIILLPVLYAVANHTLNVSVMHIYSSNITDPHNDYFPLSLEGQVKKAGVFPAHLYFRKPTQVFWMTPPEAGEMQEVQLGHFDLDYIGVAAGHGRIKQKTVFHIDNQEMFALFTKYMITNEEFTWRLYCPDVHIEALSFIPTWSNLKLTKDVVFNGIDNFKDVEIVDFQLPNADKDGGIAFYATTILKNPSPFGMQLGRLDFDLYYKGLLLGPAFSPSVNLTPSLNVVNLQGRLTPYTNNQTALNILGELMTQYINGEVSPTQAVGKSVTTSSGITPNWLEEGIKALTINVPFKSPIQINPIKNIVIKQFNLTYLADSDPYGPTASSDSLSAQIGLPFGFPLNIVSAKNEITLVDDKTNTPMAVVDGVYSNSETQLDIVASGQTAGTLYLTLRPSLMRLPEQTDAARKEFQYFQKEFVFSGIDTKLFNGSSVAVTDTPVGRIVLNGIKFSVKSGLLGLQGLNHYPTTINGVDVIGGTSDGLKLSVNTTIINPSNVNVQSGNVTLLFLNHDVIGNVYLENLNLVIGENNVTAISTFSPKVSPYGYETLNRYVSGLDTPVNISGFEGSTPIDSLVPAFSAMRLNSTLGGLRTELVQQASLVVLNSTGITSDVAHSIVNLNNPFTSGLQITHISSNVTMHGIFVAQIDTDLDFSAAGKSVTASPNIPLHLNLYPPDMFALLRALALQAGEDVRPLDGIVSIGGYTYSPTTSANSDRRPSKRSLHEELLAERGLPDEPATHTLEKRKTNMYTGFNLPNFVTKAFSVASANLEIVSQTKIGDYATPLTFSQQNVPMRTDETLNLLLPVLAKPIVQKIIDGSNLMINTVVILNPTLKQFRTHMVGAITNAGPFDAVISFPQGLQLSWNNRVLGQIAMPNITLVAEEGAQIDLEADFAVASVDALTEFTKFLVTQQSFVWEVSGEGITVSAIGFDTTGLTMSKTVILTGLNNLKNAVEVTTYDLPYNDPAGGIHLTAESVIHNPSQIGIQLSRFGTTAWRNNTELGPVAADSAFTLQPLSTTRLPLSGRLQHQDSTHGLATLSQTFTDVVHGKTIPIQIRGDYAGPSEVTWLNEGIKLLTISSHLPARHFSVIKGIQLHQMTLMFSVKNAWSPTASSSNTEAPFYLPFAFPIDITQAGGGFIQGYKGTDVALLNIPMSPATTDVEQRVMSLKFSNVPMKAYSNKHSQFSRFLADTTAQKSVSFRLHGNADSIARTAAGVVTITDIPFDVTTSLAGLQNLNARPVVTSNLDVKHGYKSYLLITLVASMYNPSPITIGTGDVSFSLQYKGRSIGTAEVSDLVLVPGVNKVSTNVHYSPHGAANVAAGQNLLENYVQGIESTSTIIGSRDTTPIASLKEALSGIQLSTQIPPLHQLLIIEAKLVIPKNIAQTSTAQASFQLRNPFTASINLVKVNAKAYYEGIYLGVIDQTLSPQIHAGGHTTITSRTLPLKMDLDPKHLIQFVEKAAANTNTDLGPLTEQFNKVMAMSSTKTTVEPYPDSNPPNCHSGNQFDVFGAVMSLLKGLKVTLDIQSTVKLDDYQTNLNFQQSPVPTDTDRTALYLIGPIGAPIVQNLVDQATLSFTMTNITKLRDGGFHLDLQGQLLNTGPFDAQIEFPEGVKVTWQGQDIAKISLPPICAAANAGVPNLRTTGELTITNQAGFTKFSTYILHNSDFTWTISTNKLRVRALNIVFNNVKISKTLHFKAFNGLPGVNITSFDIPGETSNSLKITTGTSIPSPATLSIDLETANFDIYFDNQYVGPAHSTSLFLKGQATTSSLLHGFITHKSGNAEVQATGKLFSQYLQGKNSQLSVKGVSVVTRENGNKPVSWLSKAFKTLTLNVVLPGHIYRIVYAITISDLFLTMMQQSHTWAPPTGSNQSVATYANPLHFTLTPLQASLDAKMIYQNAVAATLNLPMRNARAGTSHGPNDHQPLIVSWKSVPLVAQDRSAFMALLVKLLDTSRASFGISGTASLVGKMVIGNIPIHGIPFNVTTSMAGFDSFTGNATLKRLDVKHGTPQYLDNTGMLVLTNPSNITVHTTGISLPVFYQNTYIGRSIMNNKIIVPGENFFDTIVRFQPDSHNNSVALEMLTRYAQPQPGHGAVSIPYQTPVVIRGTANADPPLTPFASLVPGMEKAYVESSVPGIAIRVLNQIDSFFDVLTLFSAPGFRPYIYIQLTFRNDFPVPQTFKRIQCDATMAGTTTPVIASFTENHVTNCRIPGATATKVNPGFHKCDKIYNVLVPQGLIASAPSIGKNLNVNNLVQIMVDDNGYVADGFRYNEEDVLTTYALSIGNTVLVNITTVLDLINGILDTLPKLPSTEVSKITDSFSKLGTEGIIQLANTEWKQVICALEKLPLSLIHTADCSSNTAAGKIAASVFVSSSEQCKSNSFAAKWLERSRSSQRRQLLSASKNVSVTRPIKWV
ncbi:hypothetical protein MBRA1_003193 [Malassezia brasiliensis]|uniref:Uncharacterized protein n=1 Tax=Malassezia brasiliensis TaxID=1821822 RepID=A0AAF0DW93_9BASI|nr:hypothetical protein MBRA1_003193 [Malassezia brasiliensis]